MPTASVEVVHTAVSYEVSGTAVQPEIAVPLEVKSTVPVGAGGPGGPTVAVMVTSCPELGRIGRTGHRSCAGRGPRQTEDCAAAVEAGSACGVCAIRGCPIEVPIGGLHQPGERRFAVISVVEAVQRGQHAAGVILKTVPQPLVGMQ